MNLPLFAVPYKTVIFSTTSSSVKEEEFGSISSFSRENALLFRQKHTAKTKSPRNSIPPAVKKATEYELVLSATKP